ncbi:ABC transporter ATP-binding protein [Gemmatimonas sp. UBA7669]|uniref:ABC transporter ATP-binding protein n=1 Tax=Gemmatimonas sp. UBA7669 TaxID=1946568 RepID=UPI0025BDD39E|nr:ABC transporter ATP-binding protein [Gemmatimonas sp. UBA7669]
MLALLSSRQKRLFVAIQLFFVLVAMLQVLGAGSVAPFLALLSNPTVLQENELAITIVKWLGIETDLQAVLVFAIAMMVLVAFSNMMAAAAVWVTYKFSLSVGHSIQKDLLTYYLYRPYVEIASTNSSDLISRVSVGAPRFAFNVLQPALIITSQGAIALVIFVGLSLYKPLIVLFLGGLIGGGYAILFLVVRTKLVTHGENVWRLGQRKLRLLTEGLGGLKEIRVAGREEYYRVAYLASSSAANASESVIGVLGDVPRFLLETIAFSSMLLLATVLLYQGESRANVVALLSLFAVTGYRLLPAGQAIFKAISQIRSNLPVIDEISADALSGRALTPHDGAVRYRDAGLISIGATECITVDSVSFKYPGTSTAVLERVSAHIPGNALTAIVGVSGSGKSTLSDILLGLLPPESGEVRIADKSLAEVGSAWLASIGYVPQGIFIVDGTILDNIVFGAEGPVDHVRLQKALVAAQLLEFVRSTAEGVEFRVGERGSRLSGGQRQRLGIARALYREAKVLVLDEPTSALDNQTESEIIGTLVDLKRNHTIIMITHRLSTIVASDHLIVMEKGRVVAEGHHRELSQSSEGYRALLERDAAHASST